MKIFNKLVGFFIIGGAILVLIGVLMPESSDPTSFGGAKLGFFAYGTLFLFIAVVMLSINAVINFYKKHTSN